MEDSPWPDTLMEHLGIEFLTLEPALVCARMPVDRRTRQPAGLLHGGASVALAESVASIGGMLSVRDEGRTVVGVEINANHVRAVRAGWVTAIAQPLHRGRATQVWEVRVEDDSGRLVCISRCTLAVLDGQGEQCFSIVEK
jgi:1,4-dihydroxy-2-naphthoyl-CoA hydrolase